MLIPVDILFITNFLALWAMCVAWFVSFDDPSSHWFSVHDILDILDVLLPHYQPFISKTASESFRFEVHIHL